MYVLFATLLVQLPPGDACPLPSASVISKLNIDAQAAYDAGQYNEAVNLWIQTLQLYPTCSQNALHHRTKHVFHALNALERVRGKTDAPCDDPALKAAG